MVCIRSSNRVILILRRFAGNPHLRKEEICLNHSPTSVPITTATPTLVPFVKLSPPTLYPTNPTTATTPTTGECPTMRPNIKLTITPVPTLSPSQLCSSKTPITIVSTEPSKLPTLFPTKIPSPNPTNGGVGLSSTSNPTKSPRCLTPSTHLTLSPTDLPLQIQQTSLPTCKINGKPTGPDVSSNYRHCPQKSQKVENPIFDSVYSKILLEVRQC